MQWPHWNAATRHGVTPHNAIASVSLLHDRQAADSHVRSVGVRV
jgi:hypothetical protein